MNTTNKIAFSFIETGEKEVGRFLKKLLPGFTQPPFEMELYEHLDDNGTSMEDTRIIVGKKNGITIARRIITIEKIKEFGQAYEPFYDAGDYCGFFEDIKAEKRIAIAKRERQIKNGTYWKSENSLCFQHTVNYLIFIKGATL